MMTERKEPRQISLHRDGCYEVDVVWRDGSTSRYLAGSLRPNDLADALERVVAEIRTYDRVPEQSER